ncbi:putative oxidoreductase [Yersinia frederiksenii]|uniref:Aldo/keto reductase family protein n=2 Tax=Yersinia frederiksenii TaxID=29484 RepID=A0ABR4VY87_YERFR|nr:aldo/keto reductase [Yersinia frederiksenii]KGA44598.1 aldo/keto reductase family protein [Yersinia frederiksenii ATCC 33641]SUP75722.1 putative oxidoreductase [Yersinia frederiksenii]
MIRLTRRQFGKATAATTAALALFGTKAIAEPSSIQYVKFPDGSHAPALGQGTFRLAEGRRPAEQEESALKTGIALGMTLLDTAEMYGDGSAEAMIGRVIAGERKNVYLVSKVLPYHATAQGIRKACNASLSRMGTQYLDLFLLHWRDSSTDLKEVVNTFEELRQSGQIRRWGVSNFEISDLEELFAIPGGEQCVTNQVRYSLMDRNIEQDLIPWCEKHGLPIMAYSPLGKGSLLKNDTLISVATRLKCTPAAVAIAWTMRNGETISIPSAGSSEHVKENAKALSLKLTIDDLRELDKAFPI